MSREAIITLIEPLKNAVSCYEDILMEYISKNGVRIVGTIFPLIPPEITSAFVIETVKLPETIISGRIPFSTLKKIYSAVILPESPMPCCAVDLSSVEVYRVKYPSGYGEDASVSLHNETAAMLKKIFDIELKNIDIPTLQKKCETFETLRRSIRSLSSLRNEMKGIITNGELNLVFEVSTIFPPDIALQLITPLLDTLRSRNVEPVEEKVKALIYGAREIPSHITDFIEKSGIELQEDDTCTGRRLFDISLNSSSEFIFYELLDAYSYRPMYPCVRKVEERYELLYKLLRNYGINLLIFYKDDICGLSSGDISYLRIRMMRDGIDPLVIDNNNYIEEIDNYMRRI